MKKVFFIFLLAIVVYSCSEQSKSKTDSRTAELVPLKTKNEDLVQNFNNAKSTADSIVKKIIQRESLDSFNIAYEFRYDNQIKVISDSLDRLPNSYNFLYGLFHNNDTIMSSIIEVDTSNKILSSELYEFFGLRKFMDNELKVGRQEAISIAKERGVNVAEADFVFTTNKHFLEEMTLFTFEGVYKQTAPFKDSVKYFWRVTSLCDGCKMLEIDAENGKVKEGRMVVRKN